MKAKTKFTEFKVETKTFVVRKSNQELLKRSEIYDYLKEDESRKAEFIFDVLKGSDDCLYTTLMSENTYDNREYIKKKGGKYTQTPDGKLWVVPLAVYEEVKNFLKICIKEEDVYEHELFRRKLLKSISE